MRLSYRLSRTKARSIHSQAPEGIFALREERRKTSMHSVRFILAILLFPNACFARSMQTVTTLCSPGRLGEVAEVGTRFLVRLRTSSRTRNDHWASNRNPAEKLISGLSRFSRAPLRLSVRAGILWEEFRSGAQFIGNLICHKTCSALLKAPRAARSANASSRRSRRTFEPRASARA
jgi:hypothetical protein